MKMGVQILPTTTLHERRGPHFTEEETKVSLQVFLCSVSQPVGGRIQ